MSHSFSPKLGRIGWKHGTRLDRYINKVMHAAQSAGQLGGRSGSGFTGARMGRGGAFGTLAGAGLYAGQQRRAIVKARIVKLKFGDLGAARAHLRYIQRDGVTKEGDPGLLYGRDSDDANGTTFLDECNGDRHQFRLIVSPEDGEQLQDLKPFIRDFMTKVEDDLETKLDWVAVDHFNTGHPHAHIIIRGKDNMGNDLLIAKDYMAHGFRTRARELLSLELGPEVEGDLTLKLGQDVGAERFTRLDRSILKHTDRGFLVVSTMPPEERTSHTAYLGRLRKLETLGLAAERQTGVWQLANDLEQQLRSLGQRGDIIKTMHKALREAQIERPGGSYSVFDKTKLGNRIVGRVAGIGLSDEINDRHYIVVDGVDGKVHYADVGQIRPELVPDKNMIVSIVVTGGEDDNKLRTRLRVLSYLNLEKLVSYDGATWLDKEMAQREPVGFADTGFGNEAINTLARRRQWLISQGFGRFNSDARFELGSDQLTELKVREVIHIAARLEKDTGLIFRRTLENEYISGACLRQITGASGTFAAIQKSQEFVLLPWKPEMERFKGVLISGRVDSSGIDWVLNSRPSRGPMIS